MKRIIPIFIMCVVFFTSCSVNHYEYWDNGTLKERGRIIKKPIKDFILKIENSFSDTLLIDTSFFLKKGIWITYNKKGEKVSKGKYKPFLIEITSAYIDSKSLETVLLYTKDSQKKGKWIYYKNNGVLRTEIWKNGRISDW